MLDSSDLEVDDYAEYPLGQPNWAERLVRRIEPIDLAILAFFVPAWVLSPLIFAIGVLALMTANSVRVRQRAAQMLVVAAVPFIFLVLASFLLSGRVP